MEKPPIGLKPKWIHDLNRMAEVLESIARYARDQKPIPEEWLEEAHELMHAEKTRQRKAEGRNPLEYRESSPADAAVEAATAAGKAMKEAAEVIEREQRDKKEGS